jgi:hypothetical protein
MVVHREDIGEVFVVQEATWASLPATINAHCEATDRAKREAGIPGRCQRVARMARPMTGFAKQSTAASHLFLIFGI